ncbi:3D domain-containing protein [Trichloromonas sp.]|uniref:3D domain-containing protein n=1 Tax=Trichloromonas sp. TaxID=3069249 RepID=UPI003D8183E6
MRFLLVLVLLSLLSGCASVRQQEFLATGYCDCSSCCAWSRDFPDFWNRHFNAGPNKGDVYTGLTASGTKPRQPYDGLISVDTLSHPWTLPHRLILPWFWFSHDGTIAADWKYYDPGTRIYLPGYGWGRVEDKGSAIQGENRLDLFFYSHRRALEWGRRTVTGTIE